MGESAVPTSQPTRGPMPRPLYRGFRGDRLRELREQRNWTQEHLAVRVQVFPTMIGKWERGAVVPEPGSVRRLAAVLEVQPQQFTDLQPADATFTDLRTWAGLTRAEAAAAAGLSERKLFLLEHLTQRPSDDVARRLAGVYGVTPAELLTVWDRDRDTAYPELARA